MDWIRKSSETITVTLWIAGDIEAIRNACREYCNEVKLCVSIKPCDYIYVYGAEAGAEITLINYPRFPEEEESLVLKAEKLGFQIALECHQGSFTVQGCGETSFHSRREDEITR